MSDTARILVVDDEVDMLETCRRILVRCGYDTDVQRSSREAIDSLSSSRYDLMITDMVMPGLGGLELARRARELQPTMPVLVITAHATVETAVKATIEGAFDYIPKPFSMDQLHAAVTRALEFGRRRGDPNDRLERASTFDLRHLVGRSPQLEGTLALIRKVAGTDSSVVITGESGTGKELVARSIHINSPRRNRRFVPLDCGAVPETLLESELFGAERGAYTGAHAGRHGVIEHADGGTLFLDELANMPLTMQAKLLRVLEERAVRRLGSTQQIAVDLRLIVASSRDLSDLVKQGRFREDLFYRLNVVGITIPPLRERVGDIELLANHFATELSKPTTGTTTVVSSAALMLLERYHWPGNVRELRNVIERALSLTEAPQIMPVDLPSHITESATAPTAVDSFQAAKRRAVAAFEESYLRQLLQHTGGNVSRAASLAGLHRTALHRLLARYDLHAATFHQGPSPHASDSCGDS